MILAFGHGELSHDFTCLMYPAADSDNTRRGTEKFGLLPRMTMMRPSQSQRFFHASPGLIVLCAFSIASPCPATFHFMQIEKVVGSVGGDVTAQAVQLRMRFSAQHIVSAGRLVARDAAGLNPVVIIDFDDDVPNDDAGGRILVVSEDLYRYTSPPVEPDFFLTSPIPASYLAAGTLTFETDSGDLIVWRFSWGGDAYTGPTTGAFTNDLDGEFGPPIGGGINFSGAQAAVFTGPASALSSNNLADYSIQSADAVLTNNAGAEFALRVPDCAADPAADPKDSDGDGAGDLCDICPTDPEKTAPGVCGCGVPDFTAGGAPVTECGEADDSPGDDNDNAGGNDNDDPTDNGNDNVPGNDNDDPADNGNDNGGPDNANDNSGNDNDDDGDDGDVTSPPGPRGCGVGIVPFFFLSMCVVLALRSRGPAIVPDAAETLSASLVLR